MARIGATYRWDDKQKKYVEVEGSYESAKKAPQKSYQKTGVVKDDTIVDPEWNQFITGEIAKHIASEQSKDINKLSLYEGQIGSGLYKPGVGKTFANASNQLGGINRNLLWNQQFIKNNAEMLGLTEDEVEEMLSSTTVNADIAKKLQEISAARAGDASVLEGKKGREWQDLKNLNNLYGMDLASEAIPSNDAALNTYRNYSREQLEQDLLDVYKHGRSKVYKLSEEDYTAAKQRLDDFMGEDVEQAFANEDINDVMDRVLGKYDSGNEELHNRFYESQEKAQNVVSYDDWIGYLDGMDRQKAAAEKQAQKQSEYDTFVRDSYNAASQNPDFAEKSQFDETITDPLYLSVMLEPGSKEQQQAVTDLGYDWYARLNGIMPVFGWNAGDSYGFEHMSPQQRDTFGYKYREEGADSAMQYLKDISWGVNKAKMEANVQQAQDYAGDNWGKAALASIGSVGKNFASNIEGIYNAGRKLVGMDVNEYDPGFLNTVESQATRHTVGEKIAAGAPGFKLFGKNIPQMAYNGLMSAADSLLNVATVGGATSPMMGFGAFNSALQSNLESGKSDRDAFVDALVEGVIETGTEYFSVEALMKDSTSPLGYFLRNLITEPSEEIVGFGANKLYDAMKYGMDSKVNKRIDELRTMGYSDGEARKQALRETLTDLFETGFTALISGGAAATTGTVKTAIANQTAGKNLQSNNEDKSMLDFATTLPLPEDIMKIAKEQLGAAAEGAQTSAAKVGRVFREMMKVVDEKTQSVVSETMRRKLDKSLKADGIDDPEMADAVTRIIADNGTATTEDYKRVASNDKALALTEGLVARYDDAVQLNEKAARIAEAAAKKARKDQTKQPADVPEGEQPADVVTGEEQSESAAETDELAAAGIPTDAEAVKGMIREEVQDLVEQDAESVVSAYEEGQDPVAYATEFRRAMQFGEEGRNLGVVLESGRLKTGSLNHLTEQQITKAYTMGRGKRVFNAEQSVKNRKGMVKVGNVDTSKINVQQLNEVQRKSVGAITKLAKIVGFNVEFIDEAKVNAKGDFVGKNGSWKKETRTITIDINAGRINKSDTNYALMQTVGHELTHFIKEFADTELFAQYQDFVIGHMSRKMQEADLDSMIDEYIEQWKASGAIIDRDGALEEIIADASGDALLNMTEADIQQLARTNPTLLQRIGEFIQKWASNVKTLIEQAYKGQTARTPVANQMLDAVEEMSNKWAALLKNASENARAAAEGSFTVTDNGAVVSNEVAEIMGSNDYAAPDNGVFSVRETAAWAKSHKEQYPNDTNFDENLALVEDFDRRVAADSVARYLVPHGRVPKTVRGPLRNNVEYVYTFDMDTKCERTYQFLAYRDAIQKRIGRQLTEDEARCLIEQMRAYGQMIPCTYCYVEGKRMKLAELYMKYLAKNSEGVMGAKYSAEEVFDIVETARSVVAGYLDDRFNTASNYTLDDALASEGFEGYRDFNMPISEEAAAEEIFDRYGITDKAAKRVVQGYVAEWVYSRRMDVPLNLVNTDVDFNTATIDERVLSFHDLATKAAQGGAKAKGIENYEPYVDQLKNVSVEDKQYMVGMGGIRKHSSNDFQIQNVQDYMLFFMDLAADKRGGVDWTGHTYTKNLDYARIFAPTNDRINVSIAMYGDNASGIRPNTQEGVVWEELQEVRKKYNNVGAMAMVTNNDQLSFALNSDWIDMIIPFHASGMKRSLYYDVLAWTDYTSKQSERLYTKGQMIDKLRQKGIKVNSSAKAADVQRMFMENFDVKVVYNEKTGKRVAPHFFPGETVQHGVKIPGHNNDAQRYFELCEQYGTNPRFFGVKVQDASGNTIDVTQHPSYLKLIKETARTDSPQEPIVAKFDMDYVNKAMSEFKGYANLAEDSYGIVDEFIREYAGKKRKVGYLTDRAKEYKQIRDEMAAEEAAKRAEQRSKIVQNINAADADTKLSVRQRVDTTETYQLRNPDQISDRVLLSNVMESAAENEAELDFVRRYRKQIDQLNEKQAELDETNAAIVEARKNKANRDEIFKLQNKADILGKQIDRMDGKLLTFEAGKPLQAVVSRERAAMKRKVDERVKAYAAKRVETVRKQEAEKREKLNQRLAEVRQKRDEKLAQLRKEKTDAVEKMRDQKNESFGRQKYLKQVNEAVNALREMVTTPTDKKHVPDFLRKPLGEFLDALDFTSVRQLNGGEPTNADAKILSATLAMRTAIEKVRKQQSGLQTSGSEFFNGYLDITDAYIEEFDNVMAKVRTAIDVASNLNDAPINRMDSDTLHELVKCLRTLKTAINQMNQMQTNAQFAHADACSLDTITFLGRVKEKNAQNKLMQKAADFIDWKNTTPYYAFKRFGKGGRSIFESLQNGWDRLAFNADEVIKFTEKTYKPEEVKAWESEIKTIELSSGKTVQMSVAQVMDMYNLARRRQAMGHLMGGGIRVETIDGKLGKSIVQAENYTLSETDIDTFRSYLSERQIEVADALQKYAASRGAEMGNEVSMRRFGYEMFTEENYWPVESDSNNMAAKDQNAHENSLLRLLNMSATKGLTKGANNAIVVRSVFDVFTDHMSDMAKYNAMALPILDMMKWLNYVERTEVEGSSSFDTQSVQKSLESAFGKEARNYIMEFIKNLNGETEGGREDAFLNKMLSNYKVAAVAANLRVGVLQITSMPRAAVAINPKYLIKGVAKWNARKGFSENGMTAKAISKVGISKWKSMGFYDTNISRNMRQMIKHDESTVDKVREWSMKLAEWGDAWTMGVLYGAVESELMLEKRMQPGTEAFDKAMNERMRDIVYRTQVVDSTMTRSHMMRQKGMITGALAFMSEPTLAMNMLNDTLFDLKMNARTAKGEKWNPAASKNLAKVFTVSTLTVSLAAVVEALFTAYRDDDEFETFGKKFYDAFLGDYRKAHSFGEKWQVFWNSSIGSNLNPLENIPIVKDMIDAWKNGAAKQMWQEFLGDLVGGTNALYAAITGEESRLADYYGASYRILNGLSKLSGIPAAASVRELVAFYNTFVAEPMGWRRVQTYENTAHDAAIAILGAISSGDDAKYNKILERGELYGITKEAISKELDADVTALYASRKLSREKAKTIMVEEAGKSGRDAEKALSKADYTLDTGLKHSDMKSDFVEGTITEQQAREYLKNYDGMRSDEIDKKLNEWKYEKETGLPYSSMKEDFIDGVFTETQVRNFRKKYGGANDDTVDKTLGEWKYERDTGLSYGEMKLDYADGVITETQARSYLAKYGMKSAEQVEESISNFDYYVATGRTTTAPKYWRIAYAYDTGANYSAYIDEAFDSIMNGGEKKKSWKQARSQIASSLASYYKSEYLDAYGTAAGEAMLERILGIYEAIGYTREYQREYIEENWFED